MNFELEKKAYIKKVQDFIYIQGFEDKPEFQEIMDYDTSDTTNDEYKYYKGLEGKYLKKTFDDAYDHKVTYIYISEVSLKNYTTYNEVKVVNTEWEFSANKSELFPRMWFSMTSSRLLSNTKVNRYNDYKIIDKETAVNEIASMKKVIEEYKNIVHKF